VAEKGLFVPEFLNRLNRDFGKFGVEVFGIDISNVTVISYQNQ
jgi:hypothetical protein